MNITDFNDLTLAVNRVRNLAAASREALLRYCELDTWAMVKVWEKLKEMAE